MKYLKQGSYSTECEFVRNNSDGTVNIKFTDLFDGEIEKTVHPEDVQWEMKDRFEHTLEIKIAEGVVKFREPVIVGWFQRYEDDVGSYLMYEYDFGMTGRYYFGPNSILGINSKMSDEDIIRRIVEFDLAHAFDHPQEDPNYNHTHWALYGNLKDRVEEILDPEE